MPLDPEVAAYLETQRHLPPRSALDIAATRERMRRAAVLSGPVPQLAGVEEVILGAGMHARDYRPEPGELPLVVYFHGGRFFSGDLESHDTVCRNLAITSGCRIVAVDYRLAPEHRFPAAVEDAHTALDWGLRQGVPVAVAGDSAGANLAAAAALAHRGKGLRCQLLVYPMIDATCSSASYAEFAEGYGPGADDMRRGWSEYLAASTDLRDPSASPLFASDVSGAAPAFVLTAQFDTLRDEGEAYARKLIESGNAVQVRRYPGMIHGFFAMQGILRAAREAMVDAGEYLSRMLA